MRDVAEQLVELADALLDVADLRLPLDDQGFLEINLVLVGEAGLLLLEFLLELLLLLLLLKLTFVTSGASSGTLFGLIKRSATGDGRCALLLERAALDRLEFFERGSEFGG